MLTKRNQVYLIAALSFVLVWRLVVWLRSEKTENDMGASLSDNQNFSGKGEPGTAKFSRKEFDCKDGTKVPTAYYGNLQTLMNNLEVLRSALGVSLHINSGYRTPSHNAKQGGERNSLHLVAKAADIVALPFSPSHVRAKILELIAAGKMQDGGIGLYKTFVHYDVGPAGRRWWG